MMPCCWSAGCLLLLCCLIRLGAAIKCWECNSKYDDSCGDPFSNYSVALVDCDQRYDEVLHLADDEGELPKASLCRKTYQMVNSEVRVVRGCGWIANSGYYADKECYQKAGTHQIQVYHCACKGDGCNRGSLPASLSWPPLLWILLLLMPFTPAAVLVL